MSSAGGERFTLGNDTRAALEVVAKARKTTFGRLVGDILDRIVEDDLVAAVLDD